MAIRFQRKDDDTSETLTLVTLASGEEYYCDGLGRATPYLVERVTDTPSDRDEALRLLYDLDGNEARVHGVAWTPVDEAPEDMIEQIASGWETGTSTVCRLSEAAA